MNAEAIYRRTDKIAVTAAALMVALLTLMGDPSLRDLSASLSFICFMGLLWRVIGSLGRLTPLNIVLSGCLLGTLVAATIAQYLLSQTAHDMVATNAPVPNNTVGVSLVIASRVLVLYVIIRWTALLDRWDNRGPLQ